MGIGPLLGIQFPVFWFEICLCHIITVGIFVLNCGPAATEERLDLGSRVISVFIKGLSAPKPHFLLILN